jgi:hypothetical protein
MDEQTRPRRRRLSGHALTFRRRRIFGRLRDGFTFDEIALEEGVSTARVRQIVTEVLSQREVDSASDHAKLQLDRLAPALQLGAEAIASGDVSAIMPYLRAIDRLDRYQTAAEANVVYDDEARRKLMEKVNRLVANLTAEDERAETRERADASGEMEEATPGAPDSPEWEREAAQPEAPPADAVAESGFFNLNRS